jgi:hypothetical protein
LLLALALVAVFGARGSLAWCPLRIVGDPRDKGADPPTCHRTPRPGSPKWDPATGENGSENRTVEGNRNFVAPGPAHVSCQSPHRRTHRCPCKARSARPPKVAKHGREVQTPPNQHGAIRGVAKKAFRPVLVSRVRGRVRVARFLGDLPFHEAGRTKGSGCALCMCVDTGGLVEAIQAA